MASLLAIKRVQGSLISPLIRYNGLRSMTILSKESAEEHKKNNYTSRMKDSGRPVSPHVTIYAFPAVALTSITNRVTGVALSLGCAGLGAVELLGGSGSALYVTQLIGSQGMLVATAAKFGVAFPITFHFLGALRHFSWDFQPERLTNEGVKSSSYILLGSSLALTTGLLFF